jgi:HD-like signal output (HDOD) protein
LIGRKTSLQTMPVLNKGVDHRLLKRLPAFSPIAVRLLGVLADERMAFKEVARLIALDPVLSGEVLRLANSGLYGRRFEVRSILQAIAMLGAGIIGEVAVTAALWRGLPRRTAPFVREWWRHSIAAALVARDSGENLSVDLAYTAALLHGMGQLALFEDAPQDYPKLIERAYADELDLLACEREVFGVDHAALSGLLLESWGLPKTLSTSVAEHHDASAATGLAFAVQTGCAGAEHFGFGRCGCQHCHSDGHDPMAELLASDYLLDTLVDKVNQIECSLG